MRITKIFDFQLFDLKTKICDHDFMEVTKSHAIRDHQLVENQENEENQFEKKEFIYKQTEKQNPIYDELSSFSNTQEEQEPQCVMFFIQLFTSSKENFENKDFDELKKNFLDIVNLIETGGLLNINEDILIQYSIDLIEIIDQLQSYQDQQQTIYHGLRIILYFFYIKNSIMVNIIQNGYLPFFQNLMHFPENHIKEATAFIVSLFYSSDDLVLIALNSNLFSEFCELFQFYLEKPNVNQSFHVLMIISSAFNNISRYFNVDENVTIEMIEKIIELYSFALEDNFENKLISRFTDFLQILKDKTNKTIISLLFEYKLPLEFYQILLNSQSFKNNSLYFFAFITKFIDEKDFLLLKEFFDYKTFLDLMIDSKNPSSFKLSYAFLILENMMKYDIELLEMVASDDFLIFIMKCFNDGEFIIKYSAGRCLFSALSAATIQSLEVIKKLFSSEIMLIALDIFETDTPDLIIQILRVFDCLLSRLRDVADGDEMEFYELFEERFLQILDELQDSTDEDVKMIAYEVQKKYYNDMDQPKSDNAI